MESILEKKNIIISSQKFKNSQAVFHFLAQKAIEDNYCDNYKQLILAFLRREKEGTTGFENMVAIPHAITQSITRSSIYILILKKPIKWKTLDGKNRVKFIIALLIPQEQRKQQHLDILSKTATKLMDQETINALHSFDKSKIYEVFK